MRAIPLIIALGRTATLVIMVASLSACGEHFAFTGHWVGHRAMNGTSDTASYVMTTVNAIKLDILPNGRFNLQDMGMPKRGYVAIQGKKAVLTVTDIAGVDMSRQSQATLENIGQIELTAQPDGTLIYHDPKSLDPSDVQIKRIPATQGGGRP